MNEPSPALPDLEGLPPLARLLCAYAPVAQRPWHALCWRLDDRLGDVVRRGGEPTIAAIRLAWWDAVLVEQDREKGGGEPLVEAWRAAAPDTARPSVGLVIDGWRTLLGEEALTSDDLERYAQGRGGGLFALISGQGDSPIARAGAVWALWDLAGHTRDAALAGAALGLGKSISADLAPFPAGRALKPLRLLAGLAVADCRAGRAPRNGFEPRHYRALLWRALFS